MIVYRLTKSSNFLAICESSCVEKFSDIYVQEVADRYGVPNSIVLDRDVRFTSKF